MTDKFKKPLLVVILSVVVVAIAIIFLKKDKTVPETASPAPEPELPINSIPVGERPFVTLTPDISGRNLLFSVTGVQSSGQLEYEMVYNADSKQEGVFGRLDLSTEKQPITKKLLLGSQSAGGKITYHEGVTGGSLTLTYDETKLKEQWNFLRFDPSDPVLSAADVRFIVTLPKTALKKDQVVVMMKPFGLPLSLPLTKTLRAGPYAYLAPIPIKGEVKIEMKLPAGEFVNPSLMAYDGKSWVPLKTKIEGETLSATTNSATIFVAVSE